jgi:hypothetical protein
VGAEVLKAGDYMAESEIPTKIGHCPLCNMKYEGDITQKTMSAETNLEEVLYFWLSINNLRNARRGLRTKMSSDLTKLVIDYYLTKKEDEGNIQ